jgi:hypothetical protein
MNRRAQILGVLCALLLLAFALSISPIEGFVYAKNPCGAYTSCSTCAAAAGCGWCSDIGSCIPMSQDGFPQRYEHGVEYDYGDNAVAGYRQDPLCGPYKFVIYPEKCSVSSVSSVSSVKK